MHMNESQKRRGAMTLLAGLLICMVFAVGTTRAAITVHPESAVQIVISSNATETEQFAAGELQQYLQKMLGTEFPISTSAPKADAIAFYIGGVDKNRPYTSRFDTKVISSGEDSYVVSVKGSNIHLAGGGDRGTLYSVYSFLESQGCRFYAPDDLYEVVPKRANLLIEQQEKTFKPHFIQREIDGNLPSNTDLEEFIDWHAKQRLNRIFGLRFYHLRQAYPDDRSKQRAWIKRGGTIQWQWICHNFSFIFPRHDNHFEKNPEFFALYKGERLPLGTADKTSYGGGNLCTTNQQVIERSAEFTIDWFNKNPKGSVVPIWPADGAVKWCECDNCSALGGMNFMSGPKGSMSRRLIVFVNEIAKIVGKVHPDRLILLPAYANYLQPEPDIQLEPNIFVQYCYHGVYSRGPQAHPYNAESAQQMRTWAKQAPGRFGIWEYFLIGDYAAKGDVPVHLPLVYRVHETMQFLKEIDTRYYFTQSSSVYRKYNPLLFYATARYCWDPDTDPNVLIDDYCDHMFGAAASSMRQYYKLLEKAVQNSTWKPKLYSDVTTPSPRVYTPEVLAQADRLLAAAHAAASDPLVKQRLTHAQEAHDYTKANIRTQNVAGLDANVPWRLARNEDHYVINADGKDADAKHFKELVRNAIDTGQFSESFERIIFRAQKRRAPIVTMQNDVLSVAVLPEIGGRLLRLVDRETGWNFMCEVPGKDTLENIGESYFNYGGYEEYIGPAFAGPGWEASFTCEQQDTTDAHRLVLEMTNETYRLNRTYTLPRGSERVLHVESVLTNISRRPQKIKLRVHPQFQLGKNPASFTLHMKDKSGGLQATSLGSEHDGPSVQPVGVWAIENPDQNRAIVNVFDPQQAGTYVFVNDEGGYFNMELMGHFQTLGAGESLSVAHAYYPVTNAAAQLPVLLNAVTNQPPKQIEIKPENDRVEYVPGPAGKAAKFSGSSLLSYESSCIKGNAGTIELWVKTDKPASDLQQVHLLGVGANDPGWFSVALDEGKLAVLMKHGRSPYKQSGEYYISLRADVSDWQAGQWHHLALTWGNIGKQKSMLQVYVDGELKEERYNITIGEQFAGNSLILGRSSANSKLKSRCELDEVRVSNGPLTADAIRKNYQRVKNGRQSQLANDTLLLLSFEETAEGVGTTRSALQRKAVESRVEAIVKTLTTTQPAK